jgi:hypothetical protein
MATVELLPPAAPAPIAVTMAAPLADKSDAGSTAWGSEAGDAPQPALPFVAAFAHRSVEDPDRFVRDALDKGGEGPSPRLGGGAVEGELDALAFAMGALWELAAESDVNQARARARAPRASARQQTGNAACAARRRRSAARARAARGLNARCVRRRRNAQDAIREAGGIPPLVHMLVAGNEDDVHQAAGAARRGAARRGGLEQHAR